MWKTGNDSTIEEFRNYVERERELYTNTIETKEYSVADVHTSEHKPNDVEVDVQLSHITKRDLMVNSFHNGA